MYPLSSIGKFPPCGFPFPWTSLVAICVLLLNYFFAHIPLPSSGSFLRVLWLSSAPRSINLHPGTINLMLRLPLRFVPGIVTGPTLNIPNVYNGCYDVTGPAGGEVINPAPCRLRPLTFVALRGLLLNIPQPSAQTETDVN